MSEHQIAGRVTFDGRIANNDICAKCEEVWPCDFTQARMQRDALRTALTAAQATIAQRDAQVAELTAALSEVSNLAGSGLMHNGTDGKNHYLSLIGLRADRALLARTPAAPEAEAYCTEDRHIVLPSGEACVCGENVTEKLL